MEGLVLDRVLYGGNRDPKRKRKGAVDAKFQYDRRFFINLKLSIATL